jgi:molybdopterin biosynthesis enzyme
VATAKVLPQAGDDLAKLKNVIAKAVGMKSAIPNPKSEILVITGGVSVGKYDLTKGRANRPRCGDLFSKGQTAAREAAVFARLNDTLIFGLPGNPVSAAVTFYLFVRNAILLMQSASNTNLRSGFAVLTSDAKGAKERDTYLPQPSRVMLPEDCSPSHCDGTDRLTLSASLEPMCWLR